MKIPILFVQCWYKVLAWEGAITRFLNSWCTAHLKITAQLPWHMIKLGGKKVGQMPWFEHMHCSLLGFVSYWVWPEHGLGQGAKGLCMWDTLGVAAWEPRRKAETNPRFNLRAIPAWKLLSRFQRRKSCTPSDPLTFIYLVGWLCSVYMVLLSF